MPLLHAAASTGSSQQLPGDDKRRANAYLKAMRSSPARPRNLAKTALIVLPLFAILVAAAWFAVRAWVLQGPPMPATGYVAMILGVIFSLVIGCGLMALLFYSSRHGYDEPYRVEDDPE
jgi:hypothetical protein